MTDCLHYLSFGTCYFYGPGDKSYYLRKIQSKVSSIMF